MGFPSCRVGGSAEARWRIPTRYPPARSIGTLTFVCDMATTTLDRSAATVGVVPKGKDKKHTRRTQHSAGSFKKPDPPRGRVGPKVALPTVSGPAMRFEQDPMYPSIVIA